MSLQSWEHNLLGLAREALSSPVFHHAHVADQNKLAQAYQHCAEITRQNSRTFYLAANLLPDDKKLGAYALYAFCRVTDDLVDNATDPDQSEYELHQWRTRASDPHPPSDDPVLLAWADTQAKFGIPHGYAVQLVDGIARDLTINRYQDFDTLAAYCYGVASTVGLMVMHLVGFDNESALPYAIKLGVALQLTNILRDIGEDWRDRHRIYLPQDELAAFGLSDESIQRGEITPEWQAFMRFQVERTRQLYAEAQAGYRLLDGDGRFAIMAASELYQAILNDIEKHNYDTFSRRAHTTTSGKLRRLPGIWVRAKWMR